MRAAEWKSLLLEAAEGAQATAERFSKPGRRGLVVGVGAAGDRTIGADAAAEREIVGTLASVKGLRILSEEMGWGGNAEGEWWAVVDPLDGSSNFSRGIPFYCTSIAVTSGPHLRDSRFAVVRNLVNGDVYFAEAGKGATKNGRPVETSDAAEVSEAVLAIDVSRASAETVSSLAPLVAAAKRQVHFGANALELSFVAEGRTDAFVDLRGRMRITDFAGAFLVAREAGAVVSDGDGSELDPEFDLDHRFSYIVSANRALHARILRTLRRGQR